MLAAQSGICQPRTGFGNTATQQNCRNPARPLLSFSKGEPFAVCVIEHSKPTTMDRDTFSSLPLHPQIGNSVISSANDKPELPATARRPKAKSKPSFNPNVKTFVLDTNVLLHDPGCLNRFGDNHVCIPVDVLSELDRFKSEPSDRGANAREVHRTLTQVFSQPDAKITEGVATQGGGTVRLVIYDPSEAKGPQLEHFQRVFPGVEKMDHRILACALYLQQQQKGSTVKLVTKDLNMQLKARAVGIACEDYLNDKVEAREVSNFEVAIIDVSPQELQRFGSSGMIELEPERRTGLVVNEYVLLSAGPKQRLPARVLLDGSFARLRVPDSIRIGHGRAIHSMNLGQACLMDALMNPEITLITAYGQAGTGKTLLSVAAGLHQVMAGAYSGLTISRPIVAMGNGVGFLPGSLQDKMRPWLQPIYDALDLLMRPVVDNKAAKKKARKPPTPASGQPATPYDHLIQDGTLEIEALCYIRGRSIPDRFFILDESQQLTPLEVKTVVTRISRGSKLVLIGDPAQIDNPYVDSRSNGLVYARQKMRGQPFAAHIPLVKGERSALAEAAAKLM
jgi:PhoH-like ATPase